MLTADERINAVGATVVGGDDGLVLELGQSVGELLVQEISLNAIRAGFYHGTRFRGRC